MRACVSGAFLFSLGMLVGCGGQSASAPSPLTPTTRSGPGTSTTQTIVASAVSQAVTNATTTVSPDGLSRTVTIPCTDGGSMSSTFTTTGPVTSSGFISSSRMEFTDCRMQAVTINGDPALLMDGAFTFERTTSGALSSMTGTTRMTGGVRFDGPGTSGRVRYDCTMTMSMQFGSDGKPAPPAVTSSGTITWEQPIGTVSVQSCGA